MTDVFAHPSRPSTFLVESGTEPGRYYTVTREHGVTVHCNCLRGQFLGDQGSMAAFTAHKCCRHVNDLLRWLGEQVKA